MDAYNFFEDIFHGKEKQPHHIMVYLTGPGSLAEKELIINSSVKLTTSNLSQEA
jgi:hypothetical protein